MGGSLPAVDSLPEDAVLLHIGVHKTGTTALQAALADAREDLAAAGVRYPGKLQAQHRAALAVLGRPWGWNNRGGAVLDRAHFDRLSARVAEHPGRVVISSEFFCEAPEDVAREVVSGLGGQRVHVVVTLRNLGKLLPSSWQQYLKYGLTTDYETWLEDVFATPGSSRMSPTFWKRQAHGAVVERWAAAVGPDRLTVVVLEDVDRSAMFTTFAQMLGVNPQILVSRMDQTSNRSMTAAEAELLVRLNAQVKKQMDWTEYVTVVRRGVAKGMVEGREPLPEEARVATPGWALDAAANEGRTAAAHIAASGVRVVGDLDALTVRLPDETGVTPTDIPIDAAVAALTAMVEAVHEQPTSRQLAGRLWREVRRHGWRSLLREKSE
jgi:hypothetical protein